MIGSGNRIGSGDRPRRLDSELIGRRAVSLLLVTALARRSRNLFKRASRLFSVASGDEKFLGSTAVYNSDTKMSLQIFTNDLRSKSFVKLIKVSRSPVNLAQNPSQHGNFRWTQICSIKDVPKLSQSMNGGMWINIADL
jgi:hypothetical protein